MVYKIEGCGKLMNRFFKVNEHVAMTKKETDEKNNKSVKERRKPLHFIHFHAGKPEKRKEGGIAGE